MTDSTVIELARDDVARKRFLAMAGRTMGAATAASALSAFIAACGSSSASSTGTATGSSTADAAGDLEIVNYALTLEYLQAQFYADVLRSGLFSSLRVLPSIQQFAAEEDQHLQALKRVAHGLGTPSKPPVGMFPLSSAAAAMSLASTIENLGAAAYLGQAANIRSKEILATALAIHSVEARHAAVLNVTLKLTPTPQGAFGRPASMQEVLAVLKPLISTR